MLQDKKLKKIRRLLFNMSERLDKQNLQEDQLVNEMPAQEQPVPATQSEIAAATPAPAPTTPVEASTNPTANPMEPPMPGMIPSGWVFPQDLAAAIETGDVTAAEVQQNEPDATLNAAPQTEVTAGDLTPAEEDTTLVESMLTQEELEVIQEYRKYKQEKMKEASENEAAAKACKEDCEETEKIVDTAVKNDLKSLEESEEDDVEEELADVEEKEKDFDPFTSSEEEEEEEDDPFKELLDDDEDDDAEIDDLVKYINDIDDAEDLPDALRKSADFIDKVLDDEDDEEEEEDELPKPLDESTHKRFNENSECRKTLKAYILAHAKAPNEKFANFLVRNIDDICEAAAEDEGIDCIECFNKIVNNYKRNGEGGLLEEVDDEVYYALDYYIGGKTRLTKMLKEYDSLDTLDYYLKKFGATELNESKLKEEVEEYSSYYTDNLTPEEENLKDWLVHYKKVDNKFANFLAKKFTDWFDVVKDSIEKGDEGESFETATQYFNYLSDIYLALGEIDDETFLESTDDIVVFAVEYYLGGVDYLDERLKEYGMEDMKDFYYRLFNITSDSAITESTKPSKFPKRHSKLAEGIDYPAGSGPQKSEIVNTTTYPHEEELVREYESKVRARRQELAAFREEVRNHRNKSYFEEEINDGVYPNKFNEALKTPYVAEKNNGKDNSWKNNTFAEKFKESKKLNFRELLEKGLLG